MRETRVGIVMGSVTMALADAGSLSYGAAPWGGDFPLRRIAMLLCGGLWTGWLATRVVSTLRSDRPDHPGWVEGILHLGGALCGIVVACLLVIDGLDLAVGLSLRRLGDQAIVPTIHLPAALYDAAGLLTVVCIAWAVTRDRSLIVWLFCSSILTGWWGVLAFATTAGPSRAHDVPAGLMTVAGCAVVIFTVTQGLIRQHRRQQAWPDRLERLAEGYPDWPGFRPAAVAAALAVLLLGCFAVTSRLTAPIALMTAAAVFGLAHRQWSPNLGRLGAALITLAVVAIPMPWFATGADQELSANLPVLFNVVVFPLAWMTFQWHWLAQVWEQQLHDGRPWTTAGRMIPVARRAGFFSGVFGLLATVRMSVWPQDFIATTPDDSVGRWVAGLAAIAALIVALMIAAVMTQKRTLVGLLVLAVSLSGLFAAVRLGLMFVAPGR